MSIDVAETANVLDANGRQMAVLCRTNNGMVLELLKFRNENGCSFPRWCYPKEELAPPDATVAAKFVQFSGKEGGYYFEDDACDALLTSKLLLINSGC